MKINIETIPHSQQRYDTVGDYWLDHDGTYQIRVSALSTDVRAMAVVIHELEEMFCVVAAGISFHDIDRFDREFQENSTLLEPGDDPAAPYYRQHQKATIIERLFIEDVGDNWQAYDKEGGEILDMNAHIFAWIFHKNFRVKKPAVYFARMKTELIIEVYENKE